LGEDREREIDKGQLERERERIEGRVRGREREGNIQSERW